MQEAYVRAYEHLAQFEGRSQFSTWLTRIVVNEALKRLDARGKLDSLDKEQYGLLFQEMLRDFASVRSRYSDVNSLRGERRAGCKSIPR